MKSFNDGTLEIAVSVAPATLSLEWRGSSDARDPTVLLRPFFDSLNYAFAKERSVVLDFRRLEYMNSSTVRPIVTFIQMASQKSKDVQVHYDSTKNWQRLSFKAVQALAAAWKNVQVRGDS